MVDTLHIFSDGPCSQYSQKKIFDLFDRKIFEHSFKFATWSYFESGHGKGAADDVGGALMVMILKMTLTYIGM